MKVRMLASLVVLGAGAIGCGDSDGAGGAGDPDVVVTRPGKEDSTFTSVQFDCTLTLPDPPNGLASLECVHGSLEVDQTGLRMGLLVPDDIGSRPAGTVLTQGNEITIYGIEGSSETAIFGAFGDSNWWTGDVTLTIGDRTDAGLSATFDGVAETTEALEAQNVTPIRMQINEVEATLP